LVRIFIGFPIVVLELDQPPQPPSVTLISLAA